MSYCSSRFVHPLLRPEGEPYLAAQPDSTGICSFFSFSSAWIGCPQPSKLPRWPRHRNAHGSWNPQIGARLLCAPSTSAQEPAPANLFWHLLISHLSPLPALHCTAPHAHTPSDPGCNNWSSPRVTDLAESMTLPASCPTGRPGHWATCPRQTPTNWRCSHPSIQPASHHGDRPERCMCFLRPSHLPHRISHLPPLPSIVVVVRGNRQGDDKRGSALHHSSKHSIRQVQSSSVKGPGAPIATAGSTMIHELPVPGQSQ